MRERDFIYKDFKKFLYNATDSADIAEELIKKNKISSATKIFIVNAYAFDLFNNKLLDKSNDFICSEDPSKQIDYFIKDDEINVKGKEKHSFFLGLLLTKLDILERSGSNEEIIRATKENIDNYIKSINNEEIKELIDDPTTNQYIISSIRSEGEPSMYFATSFLKNYKEKLGNFPDVGDFGNIYCILLSASNDDALDLIEENIKPEDLIDYSSNSAQQLPDKDNRKSTLFEERANTTENTSIERGNLTYLFELIKYYLRNNYSLEKNENVDLERFNKHFFESFKKLNEFTLQNRNNPEVIKEINYMLNCTISISNKNYTTLADFVKNELKFNDNLTKEQREIFNNFAGIMGIEQNQELNIQNLKLLDINEASELVKAYNNSNFAKEFNESQVFLLTTYGSNAVNYDKLKKEVEENRNISNEKVFNYLVNNGFQDLSGYTVTPKIFKSAVDNSINLDNIKVETKGQTIPGDLVKLIVLHGHHDFSEANIKLSKEDKEDIAEFSGLTEISKRDFKIGFFTGNSKIKKINKNLNEMMTIINSFKPSNAFFDQSTIEGIRSTQESINKYQKANWFVKLFKKNNLTKDVKKCSNIINNAFKTDYMKLSNNFSNSTFLDAKQKSAQIEKNKINIRESRENNKDISPQINL